MLPFYFISSILCSFLIERKFNKLLLSDKTIKYGFNVRNVWGSNPGPTYKRVFC